MSTMTKLPFEMLEYASIPLKGYICTRDVAALTAERVTIPAGAVFVLFSATDHFVALDGDNTVSVAWPTDVDDGTAAELNPTIRKLDGTTTNISVMLRTAGQVSLRFFGGR
jgi:hypothetical protein